MMLMLQRVSYTHPNKDLLFHHLDLSLQKHEKVALIGNNGAGKSTLLKIMAGILPPSTGRVTADASVYYVPQVFGQFNEVTIARALGIDHKLNALQEILDGRMTDANLALLDDDWTIEEKWREAFTHWKLEDLDMNQPLHTLSGGQKTKVFLSGILVHQPGVVLLDEPTNHLDAESRTILYDYVRSTAAVLVAVSHDRTLLNLFDSIAELGKNGLTLYGGNYEFYADQKAKENMALNQDLKNKEKTLRKARETEKESLERQQRLDARGRKKQEKAGLPAILLNTFKNNAEKSTSRLKGVHAEKISTLSAELSQLRKALPGADKMKIGFHDSALHRGKVLIALKEVNFGYGDQLLWKTGLSFDLASGERLAIKGANGSGKTTLIKMMLGEIQPVSGSIYRGDSRTVYIDQDYSLMDHRLTVYEQAQRFNDGALLEHDVKIRLNRFLFSRLEWDKSCSALSGGEKMRLMLCCLTISNQAPDLLILDEPTNNLDIQNTEILTSAIQQYQGTIVVVSHDARFLEEIGVERSLRLSV